MADAGLSTPTSVNYSFPAAIIAGTLYCFFLVAFGFRIAQQYFKKAPLLISFLIAFAFLRTVSFITRALFQALAVSQLFYASWTIFFAGSLCVLAANVELVFGWVDRCMAIGLWLKGKRAHGLYWKRGLLVGRLCAQTLVVSTILVVNITNSNSANARVYRDNVVTGIIVTLQCLLQCLKFVAYTRIGGFGRAKLSPDEARSWRELEDDGPKGGSNQWNMRTSARARWILFHERAEGFIENAKNLRSIGYRLITPVTFLFFVHSLYSPSSAKYDDNTSSLYSEKWWYPIVLVLETGFVIAVTFPGALYFLDVESL